MLYCRMDVGLYQTYPKTFILTPPCKTRRPFLGAALFFAIGHYQNSCQENCSLKVKKCPLTKAPQLG